MCNLRRGPARAHSCPESGPARAPGHCPVSLSHCNNMNKHPNPTIRVKCVISFISLFQNLNRSSARAHEAHLGFREGVNCSQHAYYCITPCTDRIRDFESSRVLFEFAYPPSHLSQSIILFFSFLRENIMSGWDMSPDDRAGYKPSHMAGGRWDSPGSSSGTSDFGGSGGGRLGWSDDRGGGGGGGGGRGGG